MVRLPPRETFITFCGVAILVCLGTWQVQRLEWKNDIIAKLNTGYDAGVRADNTSEAALAAWSLEDAPIGYAALDGRFLRENAILLGPRTHDGRVGYHLLIPLQVQDRTLIVNAGWVDELWKDDTESRLAGLPMETVTVKGAIHKPDWSSFASKNSPANNMWFRADLEEIAREKELENIYPFALYAHSIAPALHDVIPHAERWLPRNKHLQYALFWYAMAGALLGVYGFYVAGYNKKKAP